MRLRGLTGWQDSPAGTPPPLGWAVNAAHSGATQDEGVGKGGPLVTRSAMRITEHAHTVTSAGLWLPYPGRPQSHPPKIHGGFWACLGCTRRHPICTS